VGSISICSTVAFGQYLARLFVVRSSKRTPTAKITSELCMVMLAS
jgi:hypothetical protein